MLPPELSSFRLMDVQGRVVREIILARRYPQPTNRGDARVGDNMITARLPSV